MKSSFDLAARNIKLNWKHSLAAIVAISSGFISLCVYQGYMNDVEGIYRTTFAQTKMYGDMIVENKLFSQKEGKTDRLKYSLNENEQKLILDFFSNEETKVEALSKFLYVNGALTNSKESWIFFGKGYDLVEGEKARTENWKWDAMYGIPLKESKDKYGIHVGYSLAKHLGCSMSQIDKLYGKGAYAGFLPENRNFTCERPTLQLSAITENKQMNAVDFNIVGIIDANYKEIDSKYIQLNIEAAQELLDTKKVSYFSVMFKKGADKELIKKKFEEYVKSKNLPLKMISWEEHDVGDMFVRTMNLLSIFRNFIVTVILFIAGLSIFNTFVKIVKERTKEIGVLRSIGFSKIFVLKVFIYESLLLSILGSSIGAAISLLFTFIINNIGITYRAGVLVQPVAFKIAINPMLFTSSFCILALISLFASYLSMRSTFKLNIVDCLANNSTPTKSLKKKLA